MPSMTYISRFVSVNRVCISIDIMMTCSGYLSVLVFENKANIAHRIWQHTYG